MRTFTTQLTAKTAEDLELSLEAIVDQVRDGYTSGLALSGTWQITGDEEPDDDEEY